MAKELSKVSKNKSVKLVSLISGGIDSPVATHLMLKKGVDLVFVHMDNRPFIDDRPLNKVMSLLEHLAKLHKKDLKLYVVPHGPNQSLFASSCDRKLTCVLCRRMMYRVGENVAKLENADAILTGESLGQVASQTLDNLFVEKQSIATRVLSPLIGFDKEETIKIAKEIGTYEISILPGECCSLTPLYPETHANLKYVESEESNIDITSLLDESVSNAKIITIKFK
ncbi:MAG: hypothetical protein K0B02_01135 [DPANN group archaeon]|nr:hypothetical protein [DPANN group archaeon]